MSLRAGILGLALVAALAARAGEPGVPLEKSKAELKSLQKGQPTTGGDAALGKLREAMPQIQSPVAENLPFEPTRRKDSETGLKKKKDTRKNWLLDGMDKLDKNAKAGSGDAKANLTETKDEDDQNDSGKPESLLQLYSEQQKRDEAKATAKQTTARHADPMAPFLQGWLADSPVRGKFFDEYIWKPETVTGSGGAAAPVQLEGNPGPALAGADADPGSRRGLAGLAAAQPNPYLQGFDTPVLQDVGASNRAAAAIPVFQAGGTSTAGSLADPGPAVRPPDKKTQLPALSDDKKYFPQLNKF